MMTVLFSIAVIQSATSVAVQNNPSILAHSSVPLGELG